MTMNAAFQAALGIKTVTSAGGKEFSKSKNTLILPSDSKTQAIAPIRIGRKYFNSTPYVHIQIEKVSPLVFFRQKPL